MRTYTFTKDETGAVAVDFLVLIAAIVTLSMSIMTVLNDGAMSAADTIGDELANGAALDLATVAELSYKGAND